MSSHAPARLLAVLSLLLSLISISARAELIPPEQAFAFSARTQGEQAVQVRFAIQPGYYLYQSRFEFTSDANAVLGAAQFPKGLPHEDEWFGKQTIFRDTLNIVLPVTATEPFELTVVAQGCADIGVCYPPTTFKAKLALSAMSSPLNDDTSSRNVFGVQPAGLIDTAPAQGFSARSNSAPVPAETVVQAAASSAQPESSSEISRWMQESSLISVLFFFYIAGLGLSFTPCVLPMVPILSGIIVRNAHCTSRLRAFVLTLAYVLGMSAVYAGAGVVAAYLGQGLSAWLQNVWVLGAFALIFVALALSMFGLYSVQMPTFLQSRLSEAANRQGGSIAGLTVMGALSALIVGPCVTAPLAGALGYIANTGDPVLGGAALFTLGIGMGTLLLGVGMGVHWLPKTGAWMKGVNRVFGVMLLGTAIWIVTPVVPALVSMLAWGALLTLSGVFLRAIDPLAHNAHSWQRLLKGFGLLLLLAGAAVFLGGLAGSRSPLQPLAGLYASKSSAESSAKVRFVRIKSVSDLQAHLAKADKPVMLDFYADWCASCKEMEEETFSDPAVARAMSDFVLLQADVTANDASDRELLKQFGLFGPPGMLFFKPQGEEMKHLRVVGFMNAEKFAQVLERVQRNK